MKNLKKIGSFLLAAIMVLAMALPVAAAGENATITINGAAKDAVYKAYLVFDATIGENESISYTIPEGSDIASKTGFSDVFDTVENGEKTYVTQKEGVDDAAVIDWLKANVDTTADPAAEATNATGATSVTLSVGGYGYYYITSTVGTKSAVAVTSTNPTAELIDKVDTEPSVDPDDGKKIDGVSVKDMQVGSTANFTVTFTATNYVTKDGVATPIDSYTVTDTPNGFDIDVDTVVVKVNDSDYAIAEKAISTNVDENGVLTVVIPWDQTTYASPSTVVVSYTATLTNKILAGESSNSASVKYNNTTLPDIPVIKTYNYKIQVNKVADTENGSKLEGAQFVLKNSENKFYAVDTDGVVSWVESQTEATVVTTDADGAASFNGLASGVYTLVEVKAPDGYNLAADSTVTLSAINEEVSNTSALTVTSTVVDKAGSVLPSTGGMGTTIFYVLGGLLVVFAGVLLITKKRMSIDK